MKKTRKTRLTAASFALAILLTGCSDSVEPEILYGPAIDYDMPTESVTESSTLTTDGVIEPLDIDSLTKKLSVLKKGMTKEEVTAVFGKEPYDVIESSAVIYQYFSGDTTIVFFGETLYQAAVECNGSAFYIELGDEKSQ